MAKSPEFEAFTFSPDDPLAEEHAAILACIEEAVAALGESEQLEAVDLKSLPSGQRLLKVKPDRACGYFFAASAQAKHLNREFERFEKRHEKHPERWSPVWNTLPPQRAFDAMRKICIQINSIISVLLRRASWLTKDDLMKLLQWYDDFPWGQLPTDPAGAVARAIEEYAEEPGLDPELREAIKPVVETLTRYDMFAAARKANIRVQMALAKSVDQAPAEPVPATELRPVPRPAPAGTPGVLETLKHLYGMRPDRPRPGEVIGLDHFPLDENSPLRRQHEMLSALIAERESAARKKAKSGYHEKAEVEQFESTRAIRAQEPLALGDAVLAMAERRVHGILSPPSDASESVFGDSWEAFQWFDYVPVSGAGVPRDRLFDMLLGLAACVPQRFDPEIDRLFEDAERFAAQSPLTEGERYVLWLLRARWIEGTSLGPPPWGYEIMTRMIGDGAAFVLTPGQAWTETVNADLGRLDPARQERWKDLFRHALSATATRPSSKWLAAAKKLVDAVGTGEVVEAFRRWLPLVAQGRTIPVLSRSLGGRLDAKDEMPDDVALCLRGLVWMIQVLPGPGEWARVLSSVAVGGYKKIPEVGSRAIKVGNAAVYALSELSTIDAVAQLALLKVRVKTGPAQKEIERAFVVSAEAMALPRDQIEEMSVPSYGLQEVGIARETFGDHRAELIVTGSDAELKWFDAADKQLKSVPARVKADHADDLKDLQRSLKDIKAMLPAQRDRIDAMFLQQKTWAFEAWRERYLDHPLVGTFARRLIWSVDGTPALCVDGLATHVQGEQFPHGTTADIALWHPVGRGVEEVVAWRRRLEELGITQPFKQAHREIYLLTDAERQTETYSNRFAAHVVRQHQFSTLCASRGWKYQLSHVNNDSNSSIATRELAQWGLRAELWVNGTGEHEDSSWNESGILLRMVTDQVRFYAQEGETPLPLGEIPPLVFSEIMRDVDLFVGVSSIGNDPTWQDGGPGGAFQQYWQDYAFGDLSGTASTRKEALERLIPRLKIADRCSFTDRYLVVRGKKRTYKIHLGSGNILMEPNDQYLCIVPDSQARANPENLFLPFEGDGMLSIILSKAVMLADDTRIKDQSITRQIDGH